MNETDRTAATPCRHPFHLRCITEHLRTSRICPICRQTCTLESELLANDNLQAEQLATGHTQNDTTPNNEPNANQQPTRGRNSSIRGKNPGRRRGMVTRSQRQLNSSSRVNNSCASTVNNDNVNNTRMNIDDINKAIQTAMQVQQQQMLENLTAYIQTQLSSLSLGHHITSNVRETRNDLPSQLPRTVPIYNTISSNPNSNNSRHSHISTRSNTQVQPEKVPNIIQSWRIKFDGVKDGLHAEEFLYRVKSLAQQNLNGDYQLLCDHLHLFFAGKANEWYWQYHRSCNHLTWDDFCKEFMQKFRDIDSDMDIWESINSRHQGDKESFEEYQFHVEKLVDRLIYDSREVNKVTLKDAYPLPHVDGILSRLPSARFITGLDMKHAFWQIPLEQKSRPYTAFTVPNRPLYQYKVMPFGLCNAAQTLCRLMDQVIPAHLRTRVFVYLDDLLVLSDDFDLHMKLLEEIASYLRQAKLTNNIAKSKFCMLEIKYLGFIIGYGQIKADPQKVSAIKEFPPPTSVRQLRRFLGLSGWYRRFVENYATITCPLTDLLKKNKIFDWNQDAENAFNLLKSKLTSAPLFMTPDFSKPFVLLCDASLHGLGCVLAQKNEDGIELPIAYMSEKLTKAQRNYTVTELECLAVIKCINKFRAYIEGQEFTVVTDHASLKWLMKQKDLSGRLARWSIRLQGFSFIITHRSGSHNIVADALSRRHEVDVSELSDIGPIIDLTSKEFRSDEYLDLIKRVKENQSRLPDLRIVDDFVYKRTEHPTGDAIQESESWKLWVPVKLRETVLHRAHYPPDSSHVGMSKLAEKLKRYFYWPGMIVQIRSYVAKCSVCKSTKSPNTILRPPMGKPMTSDRPFQKLYMDLLGPYPRSKHGNIGLLIIVDHNTKFHFLHPLKKFTTHRICDYLENHVFYTFGVSETILNDNGSQYRSGHFKAFLTRFGVSHRCTAVYSPQANASERLNRSVLAAIRAYIGTDHTNWDQYLNEISGSLRSNLHRSTGFSPYFLCFGQNMVMNGQDYDLLRKLNLLSEDTNISTADKLLLARSKAKENIGNAHDVNARRYN